MVGAAALKVAERRDLFNHGYRAVQQQLQQLV